MDSFNQAGVDERNDIAGLIEQTKVFLAEKGMIVSTPPKAGPCWRRSAVRWPDPPAAAILKIVCPWTP